ncbi:MAG: tetratricopeptide repeat protein [Gemmatimonadota bacterium]
MASRISLFLAELKRRKVYQVAAIYAGIGLAIALAAAELYDVLLLPDWTPRFIVALLIAGFPVALVLAWAYEVRPEESRQALPEGEEVAAKARTPASADPSLYGGVEQQERRSIAVLPFVDMSAEGDQEYFCDGMAEELINALTKVRGLRVAARTSSFHFKGKAEHVREIGRILDVRSVLEGSVRRAKDRLRVTAQLVSVDDGYHLWSESYDRDLIDVFAIQDEISRSIVETLRPTLLGEEECGPEDERLELVVAPTRSMEAYDNHLLGRHYWEGRYEKGLMTALQYFERAVRIDPDYALPYTGVADSCTVLGLYGYVEPSQARQRAQSAIQRALELDARIPDAHASLGYYRIFLESDWEGGSEALARAINLNPDHARAHVWLGFARVQQGRFDEGFAELAVAQRLDPLSSYTLALAASARTMAGDFETAAEMLEEVLSRDPDYLFAVWLLAWTYTHISRFEDAVRLGEQAADLSGNAVHFTGWLGFAYGRAGMQDRARAVLNDLRAPEGATYVSPVYPSWIHLGLGEEDRSIELLAQAVAERAPFLFLSQDTMYRSLWSNQFAELAGKVGSGVVSRAWERPETGEIP